jgi:hypothetical protein
MRTDIEQFCHKPAGYKEANIDNKERIEGLLAYGNFDTNTGYSRIKELWEIQGCERIDKIEYERGTAKDNQVKVDNSNVRNNPAKHRHYSITKATSARYPKDLRNTGKSNDIPVQQNRKG